MLLVLMVPSLDHMREVCSELAPNEMIDLLVPGNLTQDEASTEAREMSRALGESAHFFVTSGTPINDPILATPVHVRRSA